MKFPTNSVVTVIDKSHLCYNKIFVIAKEPSSRPNYYRLRYLSSPTWFEVLCEDVKYLGSSLEHAITNYPELFL